jgi:hypothetical protein
MLQLSLFPKAHLVEDNVRDRVTYATVVMKLMVTPLMWGFFYFWRQKDSTMIDIRYGVFDTTTYRSDRLICDILEGA